MPRSPLPCLVILVGVAATSLLARAGDAKAPAELPKPPTTPEPAFENPLADAKVGETMLYKTRDLEGKWMRYFEERVLALTKDKALIETIETDETGTKTFGVENSPTSTGWRSRTPKLEDTEIQKWVPSKAKAEILYLGEPPTLAIRTTHRFLDEPKDVTVLTGPRRERQIWFSHDVAATGRAKMYPAQRGGERFVLSWAKVLTPEFCADRAARYADFVEGAPTSSNPTGGDTPGMGEPAMDEPGMGEPAMDEPAMDEPGMTDAGMGG